MQLRSRFSWPVRRSWWVAVLLLVSARPLAAGEPYAEFLRGLYDRGYGEAALEYIKFISDREDLPEDVRATLDLETANALRASARETQNADESAARLASAQDHLDKFLKDHPDNPLRGGSLCDLRRFGLDPR